jgi:AcrR family transcriptional regulator
MRTTDPIRHKAKRQQILKAATHCFERYGIRRASISQICAKARISPGHLYHYFEDKEAIIRAMADDALAAGTSLLKKQLETSDVLSIIEGLFNALGNDGPGRVLLFDMIAEAARDTHIAALLQEHSRRGRKLLSDLLRTGQGRGQVDRNLDADLGAAALISLMDGVQTLSIRNPDLPAMLAVAVFNSAVTRLLKSPGQRGKGDASGSQC